MATQVNPLTIRDQIVPVNVSDEGQFRATLDGKPYGSPTYDGLREQLLRATRRAAAKVAVPFSVLMPGRPTAVRHGVATGIHSTRGSALVRWDDNGKSDALQALFVMQRLTDDEAAEYEGLARARNEAVMALQRFEEPRKMGLRTAVRDAITEATREEDAQAE